MYFSHGPTSQGCRTTGGSVGNGAIAAMSEGDDGNIVPNDESYVMLLLKAWAEKGGRGQKNTPLVVSLFSQNAPCQCPVFFVMENQCQFL